MRLRRFALLALLALLVLVNTSTLSAQPKSPPRAETLDIAIRYRIRADRNERVQQFQDLMANLERLGFKNQPRTQPDLDILDPSAELFKGTIPSARVLEVLNDPRVQAILFAPTGFTLPEDIAKPIPVRLGLNTAGLTSRERTALHRQALDQLERLGFVNAIGYDHRGFTILRGSIPAGKLARLIKDLRGEPGGWFLADSPMELLPSPFKDVLPVRWVEVLPDADTAPLAPPAPTGKLTPALKAALAEMLAGPVRVEATLDLPAEAILESIRVKLRSDYPGSTLLGVSPFILSISFAKPADVERFANESEVNAIRLPRAATETIEPLSGEGATPTAALSTMHLDRLHALGQKGQGVRVIVIGSDFPGAAGEIGKSLPKSARIVDLTAELSPRVEPLPANAVPGRGLAAARAAVAAAPDAELVLLRVDRSSFFQLGTVARFLHGNFEYSEAMQARIVEVANVQQDLMRLKGYAFDEYRKAFGDTSDDDKPKQRRAEARIRLQEIIDLERELALTVQRYSRLQEDMKDLAVTRFSRLSQGMKPSSVQSIVVVNSLVWESGFPLDGLSELSRSIDEHFAGEALRAPTFRSATRPFPPNAPLWVQPASDIPGSVWGGPYLDVQNDGVMDFAPPSVPLPEEGLWTRELNFLGTRDAAGAATPNLANGAKVRITVQWREAHQPDTYLPPDPILPLTLRVVRQLDPTGKTRASDEMEEVARSSGPVVRLLGASTFAVYERSLEFAVPADGRYALRVQAEPLMAHRLPALRQEIEIHPRIVVEFASPSADGSRPIFTTFAPTTGGVGIPGDSPSALTIGDLSRREGKPTLLGGGPGTVLQAKPNLFAPGTLAGESGGSGTGISAAYAAGLSASLITSGSPAADILRSLQTQPGGDAVIPEGWLKWVRKR